jgi:hypothetical protein
MFTLTLIYVFVNKCNVYIDINLLFVNKHNVYIDINIRFRKQT